MRSARIYRAASRAIWLALAALGAACTSAQQRDQARLSRLERTLADAIRAGAYVCAPRELALARANADFARLELIQGNPERAGQHLLDAEQNAGAARILSPKQRCQPGQVAPSAPAQLSEAERPCTGPDADGCKTVDLDRDGFVAPDERCPEQAEDWDGFQDDDGCPDLDNDEDGVLDERDECPALAGSAALSGCTRNEYPGVALGERELRLTMPIEYEPRAATIRSVSFATLDAVALLLLEHLRVSLEIAAHSDSQADPEPNLALTQAQADAVLHYLLARGVAASRLTARGYGDTRPIESNSTSRGRAINRRLELVRTDRAP